MPLCNNRFKCLTACYLQQFLCWLLVSLKYFTLYKLGALFLFTLCFSQGLSRLQLYSIWITKNQRLLCCANIFTETCLHHNIHDHLLYLMVDCVKRKQSARLCAVHQRCFLVSNKVKLMDTVSQLSFFLFEGVDHIMITILLLLFKFHQMKNQ